MSEDSLTQRHVRILLVLAEGARHGYAISKAITELSGGDVRLLPGSLYRALGQLERRDLIEETEPAGDDERRRTYRLTPEGKQALGEELRRMAGLAEEGRRIGVIGTGT